MTQIAQVTDADLPAVHALFREYLYWTHAMLAQLYDVHLDTEGQLAHDMAGIQKYYPPRGRLLLARAGPAAAGCAAMQTPAPYSAKLKRVYVSPAYRGRGIGRALLQALIADLGAAGYTTLRLESPRFMQEAHGLYRSLGFQLCAPFLDSEVPPKYHDNLIFMERALDP